jgi:5-methylcytosine-specific restriction endonuclease McrA
VTTSKTCKKCSIKKALDQFSKDATKSDGLRGYCRSCHVQMTKVWAANNQERSNATHLAWKRAHPEKTHAYYEKNAEATKARSAKWYADNKKRALALAKEYVKLNRDRVRANQKAWRDKNKEYTRVYGIRYKRENLPSILAINSTARARKRAVGGSYTAAQIDRLFGRQAGRCAICRCKLAKSYHRDHIVPLVLGGSNDISNIQLLCRSCNCSKGGKDPIAHAQEIGRLL